MRKKNIEISEEIEREIYLANRQQRIMEFGEMLKDVNEHTIHAICSVVFEQENFNNHIAKEKHRLTSVREEEKVLQSLLKDARDTIKDFDKKYKEFKNRIRE